MRMEKLFGGTVQKDWLIASNNQHKVEEIKLFFEKNGVGLNAISLKDAGIEIEVDETESTFEGNAWLKAKALRNLWKGNILADDSGLCVNAMGGAPGVHSARYAGEPVSHAKNVSKLLAEMSSSTDRAAHFLTVLVGYYNDAPFEVKGYVYGKINRAPMGWDGFGYDPIFIPNDCSRTFAELSNEEKNLLSHRANALHLLLERIKSLG